MSKVILVTGTSSGFGALAAPLLAARGHKVFATMRDIDGRNRTAARAMRESGHDITVLDLEMANTESNESAVKQVIADAGRIDVLINNAGRFHIGVGESFTEQDLQHIYDTDVLGPWRLIRAALPHMRQQKEGYIITVTSTLARFSCPFMTAYASAKHALEGLLHGMRHELKPFDIDFTFIEPGIYPTKVFEKSGRGSDVARNAAYGPMANVAEQTMQQLKTMFAGPDANNPMLVATAMADLIETERSRRPIRLPVDPQGADFTNRVNAVHQEEYEKVLTAAGMGALL